MLDNPQLQHRIDNQSRKMCSKFEYGPWIDNPVFLIYILFYEQNRVDISVSASLYLIINSIELTFKGSCVLRCTVQRGHSLCIE